MVVAFQRRRLFADPKTCDHFNRVEHGKELVGSAHLQLTIYEANTIIIFQNQMGGLKNHFSPHLRFLQVEVVLCIK